MNVLLFYLVVFLYLGLIFLFTFLFMLLLILFSSLIIRYQYFIFLLFIFILLNEQKNEARKLTRLKKFKRGTPKAIKFSAELASLKHR